MPSLGLRYSAATKSPYIQKDHAEIKKNFELKAAAIGKEFLQKING